VIVAQRLMLEGNHYLLNIKLLAPPSRTCEPSESTV
jgi:hypothetical protein